MRNYNSIVYIGSWHTKAFLHSLLLLKNYGIEAYIFLGESIVIQNRGFCAITKN